MNTHPIRVFDPGGISNPQPQILPINRSQQRRPPKRRKLGPTLRTVMEKSLLPKLAGLDRKSTTIRDIKRALDRWEAYWTTKAEPPENSSTLNAEGERIRNPFPSETTKPVTTDQKPRVPVQLRVRGVKRRHLEEFRMHLQQSCSARGKPFAKSTINGELGSIRQILCEAEKHQLLSNRPRVERLAAKPAPKFYLQREQINRLWLECDRCTWPRLPGMSTGDWWRCALCLLWTYGFRTQELLAFQAGKTKLVWADITLATETPNPEGTAHNEFGWLTYVPQKQQWAKPDPLYLPLTIHTRAAVDWLAGAARSQCNGALPPDRPLFPWSKAHKSLYAQWEAMQVRAGVATKAGSPFEIKHLRKSAATFLEHHWPGLGEAIVGWADRDGQTSKRSKVAADHYVVDELTMVEKMATYQQPECFAELLKKPSQQMLLFEQ